MKQKNTFKGMLALLVCMVLAACGKPPAETRCTPGQMLTLICDSQSYSANMDLLSFGSNEFSRHVSGQYGLEAETLEGGAILYGEATAGIEIAVLVLPDTASAGAVEEALQAYVQERIQSLFGYMPDAVFLLEQAVITTHGRHVALLVCEDPQAAEQAFMDSFEADPEAVSEMTGRSRNARSRPAVSEPEGDDELAGMPYEPDAVLQAWKTGDASGLSEKNKRILDSASRVISELITDDMTEYEKELAIFDWIIDWADYDYETQNPLPSARPTPDNDNPYGPLFGKRAICSGYTSTFQLFMDMLEIECITVNGTAYRGTEEHAWNMVRLDGEWYCVDVTWGDPIGAFGGNDWVKHQFFNVTSRFMRETDHQWEESGVPEATATTHQWRSEK